MCKHEWKDLKKGSLLNIRTIIPVTIKKWRFNINLLHENKTHCGNTYTIGIQNIFDKLRLKDDEECDSAQKYKQNVDITKKLLSPQSRLFEARES